MLVEAVLLDGQKFKGFNPNYFDYNAPKERCFTFQTTSASFVRRHETIERRREVSKIYKSNLKSLKLTIHEIGSGEILDEIQINSFN